MRLMERRLRDVTVRDSVPDDYRRAFDPASARLIRACIQPAGNRLNAQLYGERAENMLTLLTADLGKLTPGMGVQVYSPSGCDYVVRSAEGWQGHTRATLEEIPPEMRKEGG